MKTKVVLLSDSFIHHICSRADIVCLIIAYTAFDCEIVLVDKLTFLILSIVIKSVSMI